LTTTERFGARHDLRIMFYRCALSRLN